MPQSCLLHLDMVVLLSQEDGCHEPPRTATCSRKDADLPHQGDSLGGSGHWQAARQLKSSGTPMTAMDPRLSALSALQAHSRTDVSIHRPHSHIRRRAGVHATRLIAQPESSPGGPSRGSKAACCVCGRSSMNFKRCPVHGAGHTPSVVGALSKLLQGQRSRPGRELWRVKG